MIVNRIHDWARRQPAKTAVIWNDVSLSYLSFSNAIQASIEFFRRENLPVGRTAIVLVNGLLDAWIIVMALRAIGLNTISVLTIAGAESLRISDAACIVVTQTEAAERPNLAAKVASGARVIVVPLSNYSTNDTSPVSTLWPFDDGPRFGGHIIYTSGTTGKYKKVMLSGEYEDRRNRTRVQLYSFDTNTIYHGTSFGIWTGNGFKTPSAIWHAGGCVVLDQREEVFENFFLHRVTFAKLAPTMLKELLDARGPLVRPVDGFSISVGGGFLPINLAEQSIRTLTEDLIINYSSSEISSARLSSHFRTKEDIHWLTPTDAGAVQIADDNGQECAINEEGKLRIALSDIDCHEYLDDETASAGAFRHGFFYPGDLAVKRNDGRIRILGRADDVLVLGGQKVAAAPIEHAIQSFLQVDEVCIFSGLTEQGSEELVIAIKADRNIPKPQLESLARRFPRFEKARISVHNEFPRTETGMRKTNRRRLKRLVFENLDQIDESICTAPSAGS
jgi:acyl-coenzyme A synthetase/AMP-(fatty) acid ligase